MHAIVTNDMLRRTRHCLRQALPGARSSHVAESLAAALGFRTSIALQSWLADAGQYHGRPTRVDMVAFAARMHEFGHDQLRVLSESVEEDSGVSPLLEQDPSRAVSGLMEVVMSDGAGDPDWHPRIEHLLRAGVPILQWLHARSMASLDGFGLQQVIALDHLIRVGEGGGHPGMPAELRLEARGYVASLPHDPLRPQVRLDQHGYPRMLIHKALPSVNDGGWAVLRADHGPEGRAWVHLEMLAPGRSTGVSVSAQRPWPTGSMNWRQIEPGTSPAPGDRGSRPLAFMAIDASDLNLPRQAAG